MEKKDCGGQRYCRCKQEGMRNIRLCIKQSFLPCKSAFINATFASKKIIGKGKVYQLVSKGTKVSETETQTAGAGAGQEDVGKFVLE